MKRFKLRKEFFGGLIYDNLSKESFYIDKEIYQILRSLLNNCCTDNSLHLTNEEILDSIKELLDIGILSNNYDIVPTFNSETTDNMLQSPLRVFYDITYGCNLICSHCFSNSGKKLIGELTLSQKLDLVQQLTNLGVNRVSIAGGEPLYSKDLFPFIEECSRNDIDISITTNGTLFTRKIISKLNELNLKNLTISFDGSTKDVTDSI